MCADRNVKVILSVEDRYSSALKQFQQGMEQATQATNATGAGVRQMAADNDRAVGTIDRAARATQSYGEKHLTLHGLLGTSRRETMFLEQGIAQLAGTSGVAGQALSALASDMGAVGVAVAAATYAFQQYTEWVNAAGKAEAARAERNSKVGVAAMAAEAAYNAQTQLGYLDASIKKLSEDIAVIDSGRLSYIEQAALAGVGGVEGLRKQLIELVKKRDELSSKDFISPEQIGGLLEFTTVTQKGAAAVQMLIDAELQASHIGGKSSSARQFGSDRYESLSPYGGDLGGRSAAIDAESREVGRKAEEAQRKAEAAFQRSQSLIESMQSDALRIFDQMQRGGANSANEVAKSFSDAFVNIVAEQAKLNGAANVSLIQLQKEYDTVFAAMSKSEREMLLSVMDTGGEAANGLIAQLAAIAAAGGSVEEQLNAIRAAFARLNGMTSSMYLNVFTNIRGGGAGRGGNQQGNEWDFTLEGESYAVRAAYMQQYGDYGRANEAWKAAHAAELLAQGRTPGDTASYAFGDHAVVSSPRLMLVGERGPERVDITPGTGAGGGGQGGGNVTVNFSSFTPPSEFDVQMIASKIRRYLRKEL